VPLLRCRSKHPCFQCQPLGIVLRFKVLASAVSGIPASLYGERMLEQWALQAAGHHHPLDQLKVLARLLFVPGRIPGRERHQV